MSTRTLSATAMTLLALLFGGGCAVVEREQQPPAQGNRTVNVDVVRTGPSTLVIASVHVSGRGPYRFLVDTGASISSIDQEVAEKLGLESTGENAVVSGVTGRASAKIVKVGRWRVGDVRLHEARIAVLDLRRDGRGMAGLLGSDQLYRFGSVTIDYQRERMTLGPS